MAHDQLLETLTVDQLKKTHDFYITVAQILSQRIQFYAEEFTAVTELINFNKDMAKKLAEIIESLEAKKEENGQGTVTENTAKD